MRELYSDDYESVAGDGATRLLPEGARRIAGALVFICLVGAMGVWAWRLGTRDAAEVPVIKAMAGPTRVEPEEPGGITTAHQGLEVNAVLAGQPPPRITPTAAQPAPEVLTAEDAPQGELVLAAPAMLAERLASEAGDLQMPPAEAPQDFAEIASLGTPLPADAAEALPTPETAAAAAAGPRPMNRPRNLVVARAKTAPVAAPSRRRRPRRRRRRGRPHRRRARSRRRSRGAGWCSSAPTTARR